MATTQLFVNGAAAGPAYSVAIGRGLLAEELPRFVSGGDFSGVVVVCDETVAELYGRALLPRLAPAAAQIVVVPVGERYKNLETVRFIYEALLEQGADRSTLLVALGGGVVGDMAGFVAASFMRGIPLVQAPTTLLAMVDASIGGKVGVDLPQGKNLVGAFKDPLAVFADVDTLATLPPAELRAGMAEVVKAALVGDPPLLAHIAPDDPETMRYDDAGRLPLLIRRAAAVKIAIVEADRLEGGVRAYLNLGHTFAHALELTTAFSIRHGEAVAIGLVAAARLSHRLGLCEQSLVGDVVAAVRSLGAPALYSPLAGGADQLWRAMHHDKKWRDGRPRFVLLRAAGSPTVVEDVPRQEVMPILEEMAAGVLITME